MKDRENLPATMRAVLAADGRGGVLLSSVPTPRPARGEVLVKMAAAPVNPSDFALLNNSSGRSRQYPCPAGLEGSGTVVSSGGGWIGSFLLGKRVAISARGGGSWAEYAVARAVSCVPLRREVSTEQGSMLLVNPLTAYVFVELARKERHQAIVNTAAGSAIGQMIRRRAAARRIPVINIVRRDGQLARLKADGADHVLNSTHPDFQEQLSQLAQELKATLFLDAVGGYHTAQLVGAAPRRSKIIVYGNFSGEAPSFSFYSLINSEITIEGFFLGNWARNQFPLTVLQTAAMAQQLIGTDLATRIGRKFLLVEIESAVAFAAAQSAQGKALLVLDPDIVSLNIGSTDADSA